MKTSAKKMAAAAPAKADRQFVTALARGLDILRSFDASRTMLGTMELAKITGLPQPTVWRLCHTLIECGFLRHSPSGDRLCIGAPVLGLGYAALSTMGLDQMVAQEMQRLATDFDAAVSLATPDRLEMVIVQRATGNGPLLVNLEIGSRLPISTSSFGWAYVASLTDTERAGLLRRLGTGHNREWPQVQRDMLEGVKRFGDTGYVLNLGKYHRDINAIAAPVKGDSGKATLVINCGAPSRVLPVARMKKDVAPRLLQLAGTIRAATAASEAKRMARAG